MLILSLLASSAFAADCAAPVPAEAVATLLEDAMLAYATLDEDGFRESAGNADSKLACLSDVLPTSKAAALHRVHGLRAFLDGDADLATTEFSAALNIEPSYSLSAKVAPEGGKLWRLYDGARELPTTDPVSFTIPKTTLAYVDGVKTSQRIPEYPVVLQVTTSAGKVFHSVYEPAGTRVGAIAAPGGSAAVAEVEPEDEVDMQDDPPEDEEEPAIADLDGPVVDRTPPPRVVVDRTPPPRPGAVDRTPPPRPGKVERESAPSRQSTAEREDLDRGVKETKEEKEGGKKTGGLWAGAVATGVVAGGLWGTSAAVRSSFEENPTHSKYSLTNGAWYGSVGLGVVALGLTTVAIAGSF